MPYLECYREGLIIQYDRLAIWNRCKLRQILTSLVPFTPTEHTYLN